MKSTPVAPRANTVVQTTSPATDTPSAATAGEQKSLGQLVNKRTASPFSDDQMDAGKPRPIGSRRKTGINRGSKKTAPQRQNDGPNLPEIGDVVTTRHAQALAQHLGLDYIAKRIEAAPEIYKSWTADGMSMVPDRLMGALTGTNWRDLTDKCALPHDLGYAYGTPGDTAERKRVDEKFYNDLINEAGMNKYVAKLFYVGVRLGGAEFMGTSFSWTFGRKSTQ